MGARADQGKAPGIGAALDLGEGAAQVDLGLGDRLADPGDDLDRALEQLVLGLGVLTPGVARADLVQDRRGGAGELAGVAVDELVLDLDPQAGAR